jgi:hypothetical protein
MYSSPIMSTIIKSRKMRWAGHIASIGGKRKAGKAEANRPPGGPICR